MVKQPHTALKKDLRREILHTRSRFVSLLLLVLIAVSFLFGLRMAAPDMKASMDTYLDDQRLMDVHIQSTLGLTEADIEALTQQEGTEAAVGAWAVDALASCETSNDTVTVRAVSLGTGEINTPLLTDGRMPTAADECLAEQSMLDTLGISIGDSIELDTGDGIYADSLRSSTFTITGTAKSPLYISLSRGTSTLGNGSVGAIVMLPDGAYAMDAFTDVYIRVTGAAAMNAYSDAYNAHIGSYTDALALLAPAREASRTQELKAEAQSQVDDASAAYDDAKADADAELEDARQALADARAELDDGWADYESGEAELEDARQEITDGETELADALDELNAGEEAYRSGYDQYESERSAYEEGLAEYESNLAQWERGEAAYEKSAAAYDDGLAQWEAADQELAAARETYESGLAAYTLALGLPEMQTQYEAALADYEQGEAAYSSQEEALGTTRAALDESAADLSSMRAELDSAEASLSAQKAQLDEMESSLPEGDAEAAAAYDAAVADYEAAASGVSAQEAQYQQLQADYEQGEAEYAAGRDALDDARATLDEAKTALDAQGAQLAALEAQTAGMDLDEVQAQLNAANAQIEAGQAELDDKKGALDSAASQLESGRATLDAGTAALAAAKAELDSAAPQLESASEALSAAREELDDGWSSYYSGQAELEDAKAQLADGEQELADALADLNDGEQEYADGLEEYEDGKAEADEALSDAEAKIRDAQQQVDDIKGAKWYILDRSDNAGFESYSQDAERMTRLAILFPTVFFLVAALVCLTTMTRMVSEQRSEIGTLKALGYSRLRIARKYVGYGLLASLSGGIFGLLFGGTVIPYIIVSCWKILYDFPGAMLTVRWGTAAVSVLAAVFCCTIAVLAAVLATLRSSPAALMRPLAPKPGRRILLEHIPMLWGSMKFSGKISARNLFRYKKRFWMTVVGITGCTALLITGFGLRDSILDIIPLQYQGVSTYSAVVYMDDERTSAEEKALFEQLENEPVLDGFAPCYLSNATLSGGDYTLDGNILAVQDPAELDGFMHFQDRLSQAPVGMPPDGALISEKTAELLNVEVGDTVGITDGDLRGEVAIAGIVENYVQHYLYMTCDCYAACMGTAPAADEILLRYEEDADWKSMGERILAAPAVLGVYYINDGIRSIEQSLNYGVMPAVVIIILSAAALAFVVLYNLNSINITERIRELATMKVLGFRDREIRDYVFRENTVMTLLGMALGIPAGKLFHSYLIRTVEIELVMFGRSARPLSYVWSLLLTLLFSLAVNVASGRRLRKIDMVESLKSAE